jgi:enoyl-CoA hydratase
MGMTPVGDYSSYRALKLDLRDRVMTLTLSNPGRKNAITPAMSEELAVVWFDLWRDPDVSVIVFTGEGDAFCAGYDFNAVGDELAADDKPRELMRTMTRIARLHMSAMLDCEKPILAKVRGPAYGLGASLALASDMVFVSETARIADTHVRAGMVPGDGGVFLWPLAIGMHRAKEHLMTGDPVTGPRAEAIGLVNRCLPDAELDGHVQALAEKLRDLPPNAVGFTKTAINVAMKQMAQAGFETSVGYELFTLKTDDFREATAAFLERRKGVFTGN